MSQELVNQAGFQGGPAAAFAGLGMDESLSDGIGGGYALIRYKGKVWKIQVRGEEVCSDKMTIAKPLSSPNVGDKVRISEITRFLQ